MVDVKVVEERYIAKFDHGFDFGGKVDDTIVWKSQTRPVTTNLIRELSDKDLYEGMRRGGVAVALCYAVFRARKDVHTFGFKLEKDGVSFSLKIGSDDVTRFKEEWEKWREEVEREMRRIPGRTGEEFQQYRYLYLEALEVVKTTKPRKKRKKEKEIATFSADEIFTSHDDTDVIASGGFGLVRVCKSATMGMVAVKCIKITGKEPDIEELKLRLKFEAKMQAFADHVNIVKFHGITKWHNSFGIVMELMDHGSLHHLIYNHDVRPLKWSLRLRIMRDISAGLEYIHGMKMTHGDIKPLNILMGDGLVCKIGDFGAAVMCSCSTSATLSHTKEIKTKNPNKSRPQYTQEYLAPEYFATLMKRQRFPPQDIYSFAIIIYELITRSRPFEDSRNKSEFRRKIRDDFRPDVGAIQEIVEDDLPASDVLLITKMREIMMKCWDGDPVKRMVASEVRKICDELMLDQYLDDDYLDLLSKQLIRPPASIPKARLSRFAFPFYKATDPEPRKQPPKRPHTPKTKPNPKPPVDTIYTTPNPQTPKAEPLKDPKPDRTYPKNPADPAPNPRTPPKDSGFETSAKTKSVEIEIGENLEDVLKSLTIEEDAEGYWRMKDYDRALPALMKLEGHSSSECVRGVVKMKISQTLHQLQRREEGDRYLADGINMVSSAPRDREKANLIGEQLTEVAGRYRDAGSMARASIIYGQAARFFIEIPEAISAMQGILKCIKNIRKGIKGNKHSTKSTTQSKTLIDDIMRLTTRLDRGYAEPYSRVLYEAGCFYHNIMEYKAAAKCNREARDAMRDAFGADASRYSIYGICVHNLGGNVENMGDLEEAERCFVEAIRCDELAEDWDTPEEKVESIDFTRKCLEKLRNRLRLRNKR
nr:uncharacterized protein LOC100180183 [Ciona intestinalis]|eukprot:XP_018671884.1 uncharacterized protein LOC100180183 [Ciona intestinalis]